MSTLLKRPITLARRGTRPPAHADVVIPAVSQINLLPPQYAERYALGRLKRRLVLALVAVAAVAAAVYVVTLTQLQTAQDRTAKAEQETTALLQAQQQYAEVPIVLNELSRARDARAMGMSTEIMWGPYLGAIGSVTPEGVTLTNIDMDGATPQLAPAPPENAFASASVSTIRFEGRSTQMVDTAAWIDGLDAVPGLQDAWVTVAGVEEYQGQTVYVYSSSVGVSALAYVLRFSEEG